MVTIWIHDGTIGPDSRLVGPHDHDGMVNTHDPRSRWLQIPNKRPKSCVVEFLDSCNVWYQACLVSGSLALPSLGPWDVTYAILACTLALNENVIPPTINYLGLDPECDIDVVPNYSQELRSVDVVLNNSFAFGGMNAVLALKKYLN